PELDNGFVAPQLERGHDTAGQHCVLTGHRAADQATEQTTWTSKLCRDHRLAPATFSRASRSVFWPAQTAQKLSYPGAKFSDEFEAPGPSNHLRAQSNGGDHNDHHQDHRADRRP